MKTRFILLFGALAIIACLSNCKSKDPAPAPAPAPAPVSPPPPAPVSPPAPPTPAPVDERVEALNKLKAYTWKATTVTLDNVSKTADYPNFTLVISGTDAQAAGYFDFVIEGRPLQSPWPAVGHFKFTEGLVKTAMERDDKALINYALGADGTTLQLKFNYQGSGFPGGRTAQIGGDWIFDFVKQ